jgi:ADP-ribose pyrophosphatase YjhB (NUDIX family)
MDNRNFIGVGGLVVKDGRYLLVRHTYGEYRGLWILPGGHIKPGEHIDDAVKREVYEETGIEASARMIVAVRSRVRCDTCTDCYIVFEMDYLSGSPAPDNHENDRALFLSIDEVNSLKNIVALARSIINEHHEDRLSDIQRNTSIEPYDSGNRMLRLFL